MVFKNIINACFAICIMAILGIALCGCEDLGAYEDTNEYYGSFDDIVMIDGQTKELEEYSVETYFYNEESREHFLAGEDGAYHGVPHANYVYMAIPFESDIDMDTLALYIQSQQDAAVYINVFVTDRIPTEWRSMTDNEADQAGANQTPNGGTGNGFGTGNEQVKVYDDPNPDTRIGEITVYLEKGKWSSFVLDTFYVGGTAQKSVQIKEDQYILLQIRNNSGIRIFDEEKQVYVDPQTGLELQAAEITMTNLLIRALDIVSKN